MPQEGQGGCDGWSRTSWPDGVHQSVHLDVPVLDVGAGLSQLPLGSLGGVEERGEPPTQDHGQEFPFPK